MSIRVFFTIKKAHYCKELSSGSFHYIIRTSIEYFQETLIKSKYIRSKLTPLWWIRLLTKGFGSEKNQFTSTYTVPTHNKHISLRPKKGVLIIRKVLIWGKSATQCWKKYRLFIFPKFSSSPNKPTFVRTKKVSLLREKCLLRVCLLWVGTLFSLSCYPCSNES